jgi:hypothetical protein
MEMDELMEKIEAGLTFRTPRWSLAKELGIPISTLHEYAKRIELKWAAESVATRDEARKAAVRRVTRIVRSAFVSKKFRDAVAGETLLSKIEGTEQPTRHELGGVPPGPAGGAGGAPITIATTDDALAAFKRLVKEPT